MSFVVAVCNMFSDNEQNYMQKLGIFSQDFTYTDNHNYCQMSDLLI